MKDKSSISGYIYSHADRSHAHAYLLPTVKEELAAGHKRTGAHSLFDLGCGNGSVGAHIAELGWTVNWRRSIIGGDCTGAESLSSSTVRAELGRMTISR